LNKKTVIIAVSAVVVLALAGAFVPFSGDITAWEYYRPTSFTDVAAERAALFDGIQSYQSVQEFKTSFAGSQYGLTEKEEKPSARTGGRPPHDIDKITVKGYDFHGFTGDLEAIFFNDRLMSTIFRPSDLSRFIESLSMTQGLAFDSEKRALVPPYTLVRRGYDYKGRGYVIWTDTRLQKESRLWVMKYS